MSDFEFEKVNTIKGFPELHWTGKRPYKRTDYFPAQLKERYGDFKDDWINKLFWGDNLQVMSHLLKEYRGKIDLIYIDPPFDSKADYKKKVQLKGKTIFNDNNSFEEKQYSDIWTNDEYLQFMYERLTIMRELLANNGSIYVQCDWHKSHHLRMLLDEVFGPSNFVNEIIWSYKSGGASKCSFASKHDTIFLYSKSSDYKFKEQKYKRIVDKSKGYDPRIEYHVDETTGKEYRWNIMTDVWDDIGIISPNGFERLDYPTQKPEDLIKRIIETSSDEGDLVFDCFMGSGTTQAVAMKLGRRFIGADINLGAVQTTTKRLIGVANDLKDDNKYLGFEVYNVNNYDFFRNPVEAKDLLIDALGIQRFNSTSVYDGELDGRMVKIMPVNRIATKFDLEELKANLPYQKFEKRKSENPSEPVEKITIVCMGHEPDLKFSLEQDLNYKLDIEIIDILKDKKELQFKRDSEANIVIEDGKLIIKEFYPMNLLQKLNLQNEYVEDWRQLVESVMIDWNYDGLVIAPSEVDISGNKNLVKGEYEIPKEAENIKIKITDLLSETFEMEIKNNNE